MNILYKIALVIGIIGCINWGLVGIFNFNLVEYLFGDESALTRIVYVLVLELYRLLYLLKIWIRTFILVFFYCFTLFYFFY